MTPESATQKAVLDFLAAKRIWHVRMNTGAMQAEHNGKKRFLRFGRPGMADIQATRQLAECDYPHSHQRIIWMEIKSPTGKQSKAQKEFQREVEAEGHTYLLIRSIDQVMQFFGE